MEKVWKYIVNYVETSRFHGLVPFTLALVVVFSLILVFGQGNNFTDFVKARAEIKANEQQISDYKAKMKKLGDYQRAITSNPDSLEKLAREKYHLCAPDEEVFIIKE